MSTKERRDERKGIAVTLITEWQFGRYIQRLWKRKYSASLNTSCTRQINQYFERDSAVRQHREYALVRHDTVYSGLHVFDWINFYFFIDARLLLAIGSHNFLSSAIYVDSKFVYIGTLNIMYNLDRKKSLQFSIVSCGVILGCQSYFEFRTVIIVCKCRSCPVRCKLRIELPRELFSRSGLLKLEINWKETCMRINNHDDTVGRKLIK